MVYNIASYCLKFSPVKSYSSFISIFVLVNIMFRTNVKTYLLFVGSITTVEAAYLEVFVNARDVMCSDSRLFRCEMDFILKNNTEATDIKDDATCIKGRMKNKTKKTHFFLLDPFKE